MFKAIFAKVNFYNNKYRRILAKIGIVLLIFPIIFQTTHIITVHHNHFFCHAKGIHHLHQYHKDCPIEGFKYFSFIDDAFHPVNEKPFFHSIHISSSYVFQFVNSRLRHTTLRAPPVS